MCPPTYARCIADTSVYVCINSHLRLDNKVDTRKGDGHVARFGGCDPQITAKRVMRKIFSLDQPEKS